MRSAPGASRMNPGVDREEFLTRPGDVPVHRLNAWLNAPTSEYLSNQAICCNEIRLSCKYNIQAGALVTLIQVNFGLQDQRRLEVAALEVVLGSALQLLGDRTQDHRSPEPEGKVARRARRAVNARNLRQAPESWLRR